MNLSLLVSYPSIRERLSSPSLLLYRSERCVELPFVAQNLPKRPSRILEVGGASDIVSQLLAEKGYEVWGLDIQAYQFIHPKLKAIQGDMISANLPRGYFDVAISTSTIEHVGLGEWDTVSAGADFKAIENIRTALKESGKLILTVPYGVRREVLGWARSYSREDIQSLLKNFRSISLETRVWKHATWTKSSQCDDSFSQPIKAVALILAEP